MAYSRRDVDEIRNDLLSIVERSVFQCNNRVVLNAIENCLYNGYDKDRIAAKLSSIMDSKYIPNLVDKLTCFLDLYKVQQKSKKSYGDYHHQDDDCSNAGKSENTTSQELRRKVFVRKTEEIDNNLSSDKIKQMMANAQREIEERKKALSSIKSKDSLPLNISEEMLKSDMTYQSSRIKRDFERAKKIAELQAQIRAKLSGSLINIMPPEQEKPKPLILDEEGRTIDKSGKEVNIPTVAPTLKANIRAKKREVFNKSQVLERAPVEETVKFFDDRISVKPSARLKRSLRFHEPGKFQQMAERIRMRIQLEKLQNEISQIARKTGISSATKLALIAPKQDSHADDVPNMEWWDSVILVNDLNTLGENGRIRIRSTAITNLIEHPTQMKPPNEPLKASYLPVFLTKKERKKLRRQNRRESWKEEQEKIRLGLAPPPEPKLRISNLMRVLGTEAVQDPTKIEAHVREQMAKRQKVHQDANNARKLTVEQRKEKIIRKIKEDTSCGVFVSVYRIRDLHENASKKFKVETNAKQLHMTGVVALFRDCCVVVVEGGPKQQKRYRRLMLNRIKWEEDVVKNADGNEIRNTCKLVWQGTSQKRHFGEIKFKNFPMEKMAREFFQKHQVEHYWDLAYSGAVLEASEDS